MKVLGVTLLVLLIVALVGLQYLSTTLAGPDLIVTYPNSDPGAQKLSAMKNSTGWDLRESETLHVDYAAWNSISEVSWWARIEGVTDELDHLVSEYRVDQASQEEVFFDPVAPDRISWWSPDEIKDPLKAERRFPDITWTAIYGKSESDKWVLYAHGIRW